MTLSLVVAGLAGLPSWLIESGPSRSPPSSVAATAARTGAIFFTSMNIDTCHEYLFDNVSGERRDNGVVNCAVAITDVDHSPSMLRLNAITGSFRSK
jgi:hypothetical protein